MHILIIGSLDGQIGAASQVAMSRGGKVAHADSVEQGLHHLRSGLGADLVMIDVKLDIADLIEHLRAEHMTVPVVACGVSSDTRAAVRAIKAGAKEYIPLPPDAALIAAVFTAITEDDRSMVHQDPKTKQVLRLAEQVARSDASVLITGPSGTGKELLARYIHQKSQRARKRMVAVNCAAIPEHLLESELFGHEKGAFTGAIARRIGRFEEANGGTILLDEISEMDLHLQSKLLRVIQEREVDRVGGSQPVKVDVRILATSNRNLQEAVARGAFREDLFFRLNVVELPLPALRERPQDIAILAEHFVVRFAEANDMPKPTLTPEAIRRLESHPWPGNVRELENTMHRTVLLASGREIGPDDLLFTGSASAPMPAAGVPAIDGEAGTRNLVGRTVADVERDLIIDTLHHCLGNRTHASTILGISNRTLRNKLRQYGQEGFSVPQPGEGERQIA